MARLIGPSEASREVKTIVASAGVTKGLFKSKATRPATFYVDQAATTPADILLADGTPVVDGEVTIDAYSMLPLIQFPDGVDTLYVVVDGGPAWPVYAREDDRLDALATSVAALEPGGSGEAATKTALDNEATARANADNLLTPKGRTIAAGTGLTGGGDLSADRTLNVAYGTTAGTAASGNDPRLSDARTPTAHAASHGSVGSDPITVAQSQVTGLAATLAGKVDEDALFINALDHGVVASESIDNTAALQDVIDLSAATRRPVYLPGGRYKFTTLNMDQGGTLVGDVPQFRAQSKFGDSTFSDTSRYHGTWLVSTATTGAAIISTGAASSISASRKLSFENIGLVGPGTGTSTGLKTLNMSAGRINDLIIMNFAQATYLELGYFWSIRDLQVFGCALGAAFREFNQATFWNTDLQLNTNQAIRFSACNVVALFGGCTEVNNGTPVLIDNASSVVTFYNWYFEDFNAGGTWPGPIDYAFDIAAGADFNGFVNCHWPATDTQIGRIRGNHCQVLWPQGPIQLDLGGSSQGFYMGRFSQPITYTANTMLNKIIDQATSTGLESFARDTFMPVGNKHYFGPNNTYANWIGRNSSTGHTEISSGSLVKSIPNLQAPALIAAGLTGATSPTRYVGGTITGAPTTGTFAVGDFVVSATGAIWVCTSAGTPGTWSTAAGATPPDVQEFTASGTWTRPASAKTVSVILIAGGGGGGSGRKGADGTIRCGGGSGAGGGVQIRSFDAADLTSTVTVTIGAGGVGGAAVTTNSTDGNAGTAGGRTSFGSFCSTAAGGGGSGGTATSGSGGTGVLAVAGSAGAGVSASASGGAGVGSNSGVFSAGAGASGGGITSGNVAGNGAAAGGSTYGSITSGGTGGVVDGALPTGGTAPTAKGTAGGGAGSGAASVTTNAQAGATAVGPGGGGGGGGAGRNDIGNSGAGGDGAPGRALIVTYF